MSRDTLNWGDVSVTVPPAPARAGAASGDDRGAAAPSAGRHSWSGLARGADADRVVRALTAPEGMGVVITGDRGVGKSLVGRSAIAAFGADVYTLQLRSPGNGTATPYGCLSFTLARLPQRDRKSVV